MVIPIRLGEHSYPVMIRRGALCEVGKQFRLDRKALIVTDEGVPSRYAETVAGQCGSALTVRVPQGEGSKSLSVLEVLFDRMLSNGFTRGDCIVAVGGGVVSDLSGFAASAYMRGIDYYTIPTTVLSAVDASTGGKTAVNFGGIKNIIGAFYQPKGVLIDPDTMKTLTRRQTANGLAEALKMSLTSDAELFGRFRENDPFSDLDEIIARSVLIKRAVVEQDEREKGLRRVLNFGHTIGHGIESAAKGTLLHGESIALGMLPMCAGPVREKLLSVMKKLGLPTSWNLDTEEVYRAAVHDKKAQQNGIAVVRVGNIGSYTIEVIEPEALRPLIEMVTGKESV